MSELTRSIFYHLEPLEYDGFIESLTSYISRLAKTHRISAQRILDVILNQLNEKKEYKVQREYSSILYLLNGMGNFSKKWEATLRHSTGQNDLSYLSLINWQGVIRPLVSLRKYKAWCPICFQEWKNQSLEIYEPLLWSLCQNKICPKHNVYLLSNCPNTLCNKPIPTLGSQTIPGYCSYCGTWLGSNCHPSSDINGEDLWISNTLYTMLTCNRDISKVTSRIGNRLAMNFFNPSGSIPKENTKFLASVFGVHETTINRWKRGESLSLSVLLSGCYLLQRSPFQIIDDPIDEEKICQFVQNKVKINESEKKLIEIFQKNRGGFHKEFDALVFSSKSIGDFCRRINARELVIKINNPTLYLYLENSIKQEKGLVIKTITKKIKSCKKSEKPYSLRDIAEIISIPLRTLRKITPELCKSISQRRIRLIKQATKLKGFEMNQKVFTGTIEYLRQGIYPSQAKISKLLPHRAYLLNIDIRNSIRKAKTAFGIQQ